MSDGKKRTREDDNSDNGLKSTKPSPFDLLDARMGGSTSEGFGASSSVGFGASSSSSSAFAAPTAVKRDANEVGTSSTFAAAVPAVRAPSEEASWTSVGCDVFTLRMGRADFPPLFTYPFFNLSENIFGYKGLRVSLEYTDGALDSLLKVSYLERIDKRSGLLPPNSGEEVKQPDDIETCIRKYIPNCTTDTDEFKKLEAKNKEFKPIGDLLISYKKKLNGGDEGEFEIYRATINSPGFTEYLLKMQAFLLFFIEAANYVEEDDKWEFLIIYEKTKSSDGSKYKFAGYTSLFNFFAFPNKTRKRLSQFVILPPFQGKGLGRDLYRMAYKTALEDENVIEFTVEDPNEKFDIIRDASDLLLPFPTSSTDSESKDFFIKEDPSKSIILGYVNNDFKNVVSPNIKGIPLCPNAEEHQKLVAETRKVLKLSQRQAERCVELLQFQYIRSGASTGQVIPGQSNIKTWRLAVKRRIYEIHPEIFTDIDEATRKTKIEEAYQSVREFYIYELNKIRWSL